VLLEHHRRKQRRFHAMRLLESRHWPETVLRLAVFFAVVAKRVQPALHRERREQAIDLRLALRSALFPSGDSARILSYLREAEAVYAHAGDSRVYLWHKGELRQLTRDDSWVAAAMNGIADDAREMEQHPMRHVLTMAIGVSQQLRINTYRVRPLIGSPGWGIDE